MRCPARAAFALGLALVTAAPAARARGHAAPSGGRKALVIGAGAYSGVWPPLDNPTRDAEAVARKLSELGFEVATRLNPTRAELEDASDEFLRSIHDGDVAVFYYAGHGVQIDGQNYLIPVDFRSDQESKAKFETFPVAGLTGGLEQRDSVVSVIILDACRTNGLRKGRGAVTRGLTAMPETEGMVIAFATAANSVAEDGEAGRNGVFTASLLKHLGDEGVPIGRMLKDVAQDVADQTDRKQRPAVYDNLLGEFCLVGQCGQTPETARLERENAELLRQKQAADARLEEARRAAAEAAQRAEQQRQKEAADARLEEERRAAAEAAEQLRQKQAAEARAAEARPVAETPTPRADVGPPEKVLELSPAPVPAAVSAPEIPHSLPAEAMAPPPEGAEGRKKMTAGRGWGIAALVVGGVALGTGTGLGIAAAKQTSAGKSSPQGSSVQSDVNAVNTLATGALIGWVGGGIFAATGTGLVVAF